MRLDPDSEGASTWLLEVRYRSILHRQIRLDVHMCGCQ